MKIEKILDVIESYKYVISLGVIIIALLSILAVYSEPFRIFICVSTFIPIAAYIVCKLNDFSKEPMEEGTFFFFFWW